MQCSTYNSLQYTGSAYTIYKQQNIYYSYSYSCIYSIQHTTYNIVYTVHAGRQAMYSTYNVQDIRTEQLPYDRTSRTCCTLYRPVCRYVHVHVHVCTYKKLRTGITKKRQKLKKNATDCNTPPHNPHTDDPHTLTHSLPPSLPHSLTHIASRSSCMPSFFLYFLLTD